MLTVINYTVIDYTVIDYTVINYTVINYTVINYTGLFSYQGVYGLPEAVKETDNLKAQLGVRDT